MNNRFDAVGQYIRQATIALGGTTGSGGGSGGPVGGYDGQIIQSRVAGDTTQSEQFTSGSISSLLSNLNNIRAWAKGTAQFWADIPDPASNYIHISSGSWHFQDATLPMFFAGGNTPTLPQPSGSDERYDVLIINTAGTLGWIHGAEGNPASMPTYPSTTSGSLPLWTVRMRSSGSYISRYSSGNAGYIYRDERPIIGAGGGGTTVVGGDWNTQTSGSINFRPNNVRTVGANGRYATIQSAINAAVVDDLVLIAPGTYAETLTVNKSLSLIGLDRDHVRIAVNTSLDTAINVSAGVSAYISNLTCDVGTAAGNGIYCPTGASIYAKNVKVNLSGVLQDGILGNGVVRCVNCEVDGHGNYSVPTPTIGYACVGTVSHMYLDNCAAWSCDFGARTTGGGLLHISSGSYYGNNQADIYNSETFAGEVKMSGAGYATTSGSVDWLDYPANYITVGSRHSMYTNISEALTKTLGQASATVPVVLTLTPGTYNESFTIGSYQEVRGVGGERGIIIGGTVTLNGTRASISNCRIAPSSGGAVVVSGGTPLITSNAIVGSSTGTALTVSSGTVTIRGNSFSGTQGISLSGGAVLMQENYHNSGCNTSVGGATAEIDDWMQEFTITSGTVTFGAKASGTSFTVSGGTVSTRGAYSGQFLNGNVAIVNTNPMLALTDTTASAKSFTIDVESNVADFRESGTADYTIMTLDLANSRVGFGLGNPSYPVDVYRDNDSFVAKFRNVRGDATGYGVWVDSRWNTSDNVVLRLTSNQGILAIMDVFGDGGAIMGAPTNGNKGAATLNVAGDIYKNGSAYSNPSFVLEQWAEGKIEREKHKPGADKYRRRTLDETESHIRNTYHLPGFEQLEAEDNTLGIFGAGDLLLSRVEELWTHTIDMNKGLTATSGSILDIDTRLRKLEGAKNG